MALPEIRNLPNETYDELPSPSCIPAVEKRLARIEVARAVPETWLGKTARLQGRCRAGDDSRIRAPAFPIKFCNAAQVSEEVMESMFLRFWLRTHVLNDLSSEHLFQTFDRNWELVHAQVQSYMAQYAGPRFQ